MRFLHYFCLVTIYVLSYGVGCLMYKIALWVIWKQSLGGDAYAVVFWSAFAYFPIGLVYLLICTIIKRKMMNSYLRHALYPICCALVFVIPTAIILVFNGGGSFFSPEARLFQILFVSTGVTFGLGYSVVSQAFPPK